MLMKIGSYKERSHRLNSERCCRTNSGMVENTRDNMFRHYLIIINFKLFTRWFHYFIIEIDGFTSRTWSRYCAEVWLTDPFIMQCILFILLCNLIYYFRIAAGVTINSSGPNEAGPVDLIFNMDDIVLDGQVLNINKGSKTLKIAKSFAERKYENLRKNQTQS